MTPAADAGGLEPEDDADLRETPPTPRIGAPAGPAADVVVFAALREAKGPRTAEALAAATGLPVRNVQRALGKLVAERHARRAGGGLFTISARRPPSRRGRGGAGTAQGADPAPEPTPEE